MRALIAIPARYVPAVFDALLALYSSKADALHHAAINEAAAGDVGPLREHRAELLEIDELLEQLDWCPAPRPLEIAGERETIAAAILDALCGTAERLSDACANYWRGKADLDHIAAANNTARGLIVLLRVIEIDATEPDRRAARPGCPPEATAP
jgi:hypothetical protein